MIIKNDSYFKDKTGQWWFQWGKKNIRRTKCTIKNCEGCGEEFLSPGSAYNSKTRFCGRKCSGRYSGSQVYGKRCYQYKGGKRINAAGYIEILISPEEKIKRGRARRYMLEHRLVIEKEIGRYLQPYEQVHHKNGDKEDNRIENLELWEKKHSLPGVRSSDTIKCNCCKGRGYVLKEELND